MLLQDISSLRYKRSGNESKKRKCVQTIFFDIRGSCETSKFKIWKVDCTNIWFYCYKLLFLLPWLNDIYTCTCYLNLAPHSKVGLKLLLKERCHIIVCIWKQSPNKLVPLCNSVADDEYPLPLVNLNTRKNIFTQLTVKCCEINLQSEDSTKPV